MKNQMDNMPGQSCLECPSCGASNISATSEVENFQYGDKYDAPTLSVSIRVHHCASCGFSFTTEEASELKHDAVCRHLGVMTPNEVRSVREHYGLSQGEFSELSKIGKASLARWESGVLIQNQANDNLLFLLTFCDNVTRLRERRRIQTDHSNSLTKNVVPFRPRFRALPQTDIDRMQREAERFELFPEAMIG
ncbi:type II TA system antitoxin MqsA family protein [Uliginosibacterium gangwonense]|uniref:type II TA system antitoxin MqsA family protein n=1 Tax=Uliginosibacterium gangwonense TaxID=392736 RepID=UPI0009FF381F|nr:type II TA system antitoxin MqsA family protein [Uliginosibacterium gangwonense]